MRIMTDARPLVTLEKVIPSDAAILMTMHRRRVMTSADTPRTTLAAECRRRFSFAEPTEALTRHFEMRRQRGDE